MARKKVTRRRLNFKIIGPLLVVLILGGFGVWKLAESHALTLGSWWVKGGVNNTQWGVVGDIPVPGDYNGDGKAEIAVWRPGDGVWYIRGIGNTQWGTAGDIPAPGDYNGDGKTDLAVYRPSNGTWWIYGILHGAAYGTVEDYPVPADYNGDGKAEIAVWRPSNGVWYIRGIGDTQWGTAGDIPVPGDYGGDRRAELAVWRPGDGVWYVLGIGNSQWGTAGDIPVPGDYGGDNKTDYAIWRPNDGLWYIRGISTVQWGQAGDKPTPGDYNGDGKTEYAVFRPSYVAPTSPTAPTIPRPSIGTAEAAIYKALNKERTFAGKATLKPTDCMHNRAVDWSRYLAETGKFEHQDMARVLAKCGNGDKPSYAGETLYRSNITGFTADTLASSVVTGWLNSPSHREVMLSSTPNSLGIGVVYDTSGRVIVTGNYSAKCGGACGNIYSP